ncbi:MAG: magnesium transporter [Acetobacteraceae bacterium]|nr:magnesium transporter [Acetobacteraceae bacterium]
MLTAFGCEAGRPVRLENVTDVEMLRQAVWIDLHEPTPEEASLVAEATGLDVPTLAEVSEIETSSRLGVRDGVLYLSMPMVSMIDGPRGVSAGFVLAPDRLLTVRFAVSNVFDTFVTHMPRGEARSDSAAHILIGLLEAIVDRQADVLERIQTDLDNISHRVFALGADRGSGRKMEDRILRETLVQLGRIGDLISHIRESQLGATRLVPFIEANAADWLADGLKSRLRTLRRDIGSISDFDNHLSDKLQFLLDATLGFINIAQNDVMKVMTITSVVGIPPVLVAGIYGMNFKAMPELEWAWGYPSAWFLIILTSLIPLAIFRWRKWM